MNDYKNYTFKKPLQVNHEPHRFQDIINSRYFKLIKNICNYYSSSHRPQSDKHDKYLNIKNSMNINFHGNSA